MGRHDRDDDRRKESKEERLLRKAREFVEQQSSGSRKDDDKKDRREDRKKRSRDDERRRRRDANSSDSDDDRRKRKHRHDRKKRSRRDDDYSEDDDRRRRSKKHKKKSSKKEHREEKSKPKKLKVDKSKLYNLGDDVLGRPPDRLLDVELDYFAFHQHLWVYLYREEGIAFGDLTSEDAREAFVRYCDKYNKGKLQSGYYASVLPLEAIEECKTTTHKWAFQTNSTEKESLHLIGEGVRKQTEYESAKAGLPAASVKPAARAALPEKDDNRSSSRMTAEERSAERVANRRLREHVRATADELTGGRKDYGRERQLEKKKEKAAALHGSARDREDMGGGVELADADLYGGSNNDFASALARQRKHKSKRETDKEARLVELKQKEQDRQAAMLQALGLTGIKPGQKITIAPRKDT